MSIGGTKHKQKLPKEFFVLCDELPKALGLVTCLKCARHDSLPHLIMHEVICHAGTIYNHFGTNFGPK